jgi:hypothetical protein
VSYLRDQVRFESVEALLEQMGRDCARAESIARESMGAASPRAEVAGCP